MPKSSSRSPSPNFVVVKFHAVQRFRCEHHGIVLARARLGARHLLPGPVVCIGESLEERERHLTVAVLARQLQAVIAELPPGRLGDIVIAYEPVWAIGTGHSTSPDTAQASHAAIRAVLAGASAHAARTVPILYGGSLKAGNAAALFAMPDVDGGLVGGASLHVVQFLAIARAAICHR